MNGFGGHTEFPDEEGTEIWYAWCTAGAHGTQVTPNSPMRRGLKFSVAGGAEAGTGSHTEFPDEEGTEIDEAAAVPPAARSHTEFPDEEGTEMSPSSQKILTVPCHTEFPDEEGTEI